MLRQAIERPCITAPRALDLLSDLGVFDDSPIRYAARYLSKATSGAAWPLPARSRGPNNAKASIRQVVCLLLSLCASRNTTDVAYVYEKVSRLKPDGEGWASGLTLIDLVSGILAAALDPLHEEHALLADQAGDGLLLRVTQGGGDAEILTPSESVMDFCAPGGKPVAAPAAIRVSGVVPFATLLVIIGRIREMRGDTPELMREAA